MSDDCTGANVYNFAYSVLSFTARDKLKSVTVYVCMINIRPSGIFTAFLFDKV